MLWIIIAIIVSYLLGSIPTAYLYGKLAKGIDIRKQGSGNVGATNALRVLGTPAGVFVLFIDMLKGILPVIFIGNYLLDRGVNIAPDLLRILIGIGAIIGHNWTIFLEFKGGKGVATTFGVLIGFAFAIPGFALILLLVIFSWVLTFAICRIVSLSSIISGIAFPVCMILFKPSAVLIIFSILIMCFIIIRHTANIKRLLQGKEARLSFRKSSV